MKILVLLGFLFLLNVSCTSNGDPSIIFTCDALWENWGCTKWNGGNRLQCADSVNKTMYWAAKPVRTNNYRIIAGDEDTPATSYTPGEYVDVIIRVDVYGFQYRGILLYAVDSNETRVGEWTVLPSPIQWLQKPWAAMQGHPCQSVVMHASAQWKPYHLVVKFKAPAKGTGKITFRCLIKYGDANTGAFYYPNLAGDLSLTESDTTKEYNIYQAKIGQSCDDACATINHRCVAADTHNLNDPSKLYEATKTRYICNPPLLSSCNATAPSALSDYTCYYKTDNCTDRTVSSSATSCSDVSTTSMRFCACDVKISTDKENNVGRTSVNILTLFAMCFFWMFGRKSSSQIFLIMGIVFLLSMNGAFAHNWINSVSRSPQANTFSPCLPQRNVKPHVQVGPGQEFQIEWMTGHAERKTYFVILAEKDADKMVLHKDSLLDDYIKNAPANSNQAYNNLLMKLHRKRNNDTDNFFAGVVTPTAPNYLDRPDAFGGQYNGEGYLLYYNQTLINNDARVSYKNPNYTWILAVYRFEHARHMPSEFDTARFTIPAGSPYGRYIVHYYWAGYRDCIDVDYIDHQAKYVYGNRSGPDTWTRIDHCYFPESSPRSKCVEVVTNPDYCINTCMNNAIENCYGVNLQRFKNPATVYKKFANNNSLPWMNGLCNQTIADFVGAPDDLYVCYALLPRATTDVITEYVISLDPEDPIFYSTCYLREKNLEFEGYDDTGNESQFSSRYTPWKFNDQCISCNDHVYNQQSKIIPKWVLNPVCINCDEEPGSLPKPETVFARIRNMSACDGFGGKFSIANHTACSPNTTACVKQLLPRGSPTIKVEDCIALAKRDPECSNYIISKNQTLPLYSCYCYKKLACCKTCSPVYSSNYEIYELYPSSADPTCATGKLSADGTTCCSGSCGSCRTGSSSTDVGFCNQGYVVPTRKCSQYGPPCMM